MGKISKKVSRNLGAAIKEVKEKISNETALDQDTEDLLNSGVKAQNTRKKKDKESCFPVEKSISYDEFCQIELQKALEKGLPDPYFDFRNIYKKGQIVYFVHIIEAFGEKQVKKLYLRTIYPRMMVGSEEKACCQCIGYNDKDKVFNTIKEANEYSKSINIAPKYSKDKIASEIVDDTVKEDCDG